MNSHDGFQQKVATRAAAARVTITAEEIRQLETYFSLLKRWSARMNLTALPLEGLPDHTIDRLFIEPLAAARYVAKSPLIWFDVGSGGGSPAIPLKVLRPQAKLTMVESKGRKAAFLREAVRTLQLSHADVQGVRFDQLVAPGSVDLITLRAVRTDADLLALCRASLRADGEMLLFQSSPASSGDDFTGFKRLQTVQLTHAPAHLDILRAV